MLKLRLQHVNSNKICSKISVRTFIKSMCIFIYIHNSFINLVHFQFCFVGQFGFIIQYFASRFLLTHIHKIIFNVLRSSVLLCCFPLFIHLIFFCHYVCLLCYYYSCYECSYNILFVLVEF